MPELFDDDRSRITDLAKIFLAKGHAREQRACDPEEFVLLAYIARSTIDRALGPGNPHSAALSGLCDLPNGDGAPENPANSGTLPGRYRCAAEIMRTVARDLPG